MCRQMPVAPDPSAEFLSPFQRFNPSELALPVQPRGPGASGLLLLLLPPPPSLSPTRLPRCGDGTEPPGPLQGEKASGSEDAGRTARCPQAEPEPQPEQQQPPLGAWHRYSRL